jgi:hypothetical protein
MKRFFLAVVLSVSSLLIPLMASAQSVEPTIYVIKKGDTLWGLSDRFLNDPHYWPNLWARNQSVTNPHLIYPGQRLRVYPDRIELEPSGVPAMEDQIARETTIRANGREGFILDPALNTAGAVIQTNHDRTMVGKEDIVYTDLGTSHGAKSGDTYAIFRKARPVDHPLTGEFMGYKYLALGTLKLTDIEEKSSRALITKSDLEISAGDELLPYRDKHREISLKAATRQLDGCIIDSRMGNILIGLYDIVYLDLGAAHGLEAGNLLYVVREVQPNEDAVTRDVGNLPKELIGAVVVVETAEKTSTALVVKSVEHITVGDTVSLFIK